VNYSDKFKKPKVTVNNVESAHTAHRATRLRNEDSSNIDSSNFDSSNTQRQAATSAQNAVATLPAAATQAAQSHGRGAARYRILFQAAEAICFLSAR